MDGHRRCALISGANKGLGREVAGRLCARGHFVFVGSRDVDAGERAARELRDAGGAAAAVRLDVTDPDDVHAAVDRATPTAGPAASPRALTS